MTKRARAFTALVGAALLVVALPVVASAQPFSGPMGVTGRWAIDLPRSKFNATLTGPPPLSGELDVTIDDGKALAWTLVEVDEAGVAARTRRTARPSRPATGRPESSGRGGGRRGRRS
jgi:hypothetical protein